MAENAPADLIFFYLDACGYRLIEKDVYKKIVYFLQNRFAALLVPEGSFLEALKKMKDGARLEKFTQIDKNLIEFRNGVFSLNLKKIFRAKPTL